MIDNKGCVIWLFCFHISIISFIRVQLYLYDLYAVCDLNSKTSATTCATCHIGDWCYSAEYHPSTVSVSTTKATRQQHTKPSAPKAQIQEMGIFHFYYTW